MISDKRIKQSTIEECVEYCKNKQVLGVDTETEGFDFTSKKMIMFQIGDEIEQFVIDTRTVSIEPLKEILESKTIIKIFHNAKFDYKFIKRWARINTKSIYDTYLGEKILHCGKDNHGYSLQKCCERYLNVHLDKEERNQFINLQARPFTSNQITYGAKDVEYLIQIWGKQIRLLDEAELLQVSNLENEAVIVFSEIEYEGLNLNRGEWEKLAIENKQLAKQMILELDSIVRDHPKLGKYHQPIQQDLFLPQDEIRTTNINWDSPKQILELFQCLIPKLEDVNSKNLYKHASKHLLIKKYIEYKGLSKLASAYGDEFTKFLSSDGKIHTNFQQILNTGRTSSSNPNMQQIPADNKYRNCFYPPDDWVFVSSDYSSQELNVIAYGSKDPVFLNALQNNQDLHSVCAELVFQDEWTNNSLPDCKYTHYKQKCDCPEHKKLRTKVKGINFGLAYGMGPHKLSDTLDIPLKEASELINKYFEAFPSIQKFLNQLGGYGKRHGYVMTARPFRRKRFFPNWDGGATSPKDMGEIERASKNTPIQG